MTDINNWFGVVDPQADSETLQKVRSAADSWIAKITESNDNLELLLMTLAVGTGGVGAALVQFKEELDSLFRHVSSARTLNGSVQSNELCLKIFCLMVLQLILEGDEADVDISIAEFLLSGLFIRTEKDRPKLDAIITACKEQALKCLDEQACKRREAEDPLLKLKKISNLVLTDAASTQQFLQAITEFGTALEENRSRDREEINILWWMLNGYSVERDSHFKALPAETGVLRTGLELGDLILDPPGRFLCNLLIKHQRQWFGERINDAISLEEMVATLNEDETIRLPDKYASMVDKYPYLFPIHWLLQKSRSSISTTVLKQEFEKNTTCKFTERLELHKWGQQSFYERVALRFWDLEHGD